MNYCKKCGEPAPQHHDLCWVCEHDPKLGYVDAENEPVSGGENGEGKVLENEQN